MDEHIVRVRVAPDHIQALTIASRPVLALAEGIWNGLDADATRVEVIINEGELRLESIEVQDNGHGFSPSDADSFFGSLGGSWKTRTRRTRREGRVLHGKLGRGRFKLFYLGDHLEWQSSSETNGTIETCVVSASRNNVTEFKVTGGTNGRVSVGTRLVISDPKGPFPSLQVQELIPDLTELFAPYLMEYPQVNLVVNDTLISANDAVSRRDEYEVSVTLSDGSTLDARLIVIEWRTQVKRSLLLCDESGFALREVSPGIQAKGFNFTCYVRSEFLRSLDEDGLLEVPELHPDLMNLLEAVKGKLRDHFRERAAEDATSIVDEWKRQGVYPYSEAESDIVVRTERQIFDVCALNVSEYLPDFNDTSVENRKLSLRLLRQALSESPGNLRRILADVLNLSQEKQEELAQLLERTSLSAIVEASKEVANRLDFLDGLESLVFESETKKILKERSQLHRILADETWVFGEQFNLSVSDQSLNEVLKKHSSLIGRDLDELDNAPVTRWDDSKGIVDLMLSRQVPQPGEDEREHLIIELKRPTQKVDVKVITQVESYAMAVAQDERFRDTKTNWVFWAVSNELAEEVRLKARQSGRQEGITLEVPELRTVVWARTWGQVIQAARGRLRFFQKGLNYAVNHDAGLEYLRRTHGKYLPEAAKADKD